MQHYFTLQCLLAAHLWGVTLFFGPVGAPIEARSQSTDGVCCDPCIAKVSCEDCSSAFGPNTFWDEIGGQCSPLSLQTFCSFDTDGTGLVGTPDLLNLLSSFGDECE